MDMKSLSRKSIRSTPPSNSHSKTQNLKTSISQNSEWKDIIEGIHTIAFKIKSITNKENKKTNTNVHHPKTSHIDKVNKQRGYQSLTRINSVEKNKSKNKIYQKQNKTVKNVCKPFINETGSCRNRKTQKIINRISTSTTSCNQSINKDIESHNAKTLSLSKYRETLKENTELKQLNESLVNKNEELKKKLFEEEIRVKNVKVHEIVLKIFNESDFHGSAPAKSKSTHQEEQYGQRFSISTKPFESKLENMNDLVKVSPITKKKNELMVLEKKKFLDLSETQSKIEKSNEELFPKKELPNKILSLETEFDRLMSLSHQENNKGRKRIIRDEMKVLAKELKLMRSFTNN